MKSWESGKQYCIVCDQYKEHLFEIANCGHLFCKDCCVSYIRSQAENFSKAKCLQEGCQAALNKAKPIYASLDKTTIDRMGKFELFQLLQNNKDAVACKTQDCKGYFLKSSKPTCSQCSASHCLKCLRLSHSGPCVSNKAQEEDLRALNYRKCPKCSVWVEKNGGCEFIKCKCGIQFCHRCGEEYSKDPCRKRQAWRKEKEIRKLMGRLQLSVPSELPSISSFILLLLRIVLLVVIVTPFTAIYCIVSLALLVSVVEVLVFLFMPLVVFSWLSFQKRRCKWLGYLLAVLFYPVIGALFAFLALIILLLYPYARNKYHHGAYDPLDILMCRMTVYYLKFVTMAVMCCQ